MCIRDSARTTPCGPPNPNGLLETIRLAAAFQYIPALITALSAFTGRIDPKFCRKNVFVSAAPAASACYNVAHSGRPVGNVSINFKLIRLVPAEKKD